MNKLLTKYNLRQEILKRKKQIHQYYKKFVKIESVTFSSKVEEALDFVLTEGAKLGFTASIIDGGKNKKSGHLHWGDDEEFVAIVGHVDVVPATNLAAWEFDPFCGDIKDGYLLGRGAQDDKGPMTAAFFAAYILTQLDINLPKGIRIIYGLCEEGGDWRDIKYHYKTQKPPLVSFTPDSLFPVVYAEKGSLKIKISGIIPNQEKFVIRGGSQVHVVMDSCIVKIEKRITKFSGKAQHGALCFIDGIDSAGYKALDYLNKKISNSFINFFTTNFSHDPLLKKTQIGYTHSDEGSLSCNLGFINIEENGKTEIILSMNYPQGATGREIFNKFKKLFEIFPELNLTNLSIENRVYENPDGFLVSTLYHAYQEITKDYTTPKLAIPGGTYSRIIPNCVCYGMTMPDDEWYFHQINEKIKLSSFYLAIEVYMNALYQLITTI